MDAKAEARPGSVQRWEGLRGVPRAGPVPRGAVRLLAGLLVVLLPSATAQPLGAAARRPTQGHGVPGPPRGHCGRTEAGVITDDLWLQKETNCLEMTALQLPLMVQASEVPDLILTSAALDDQWSHSIFALIPSWTRKILFKRESSVNRHLPEDVSKLSASSGFGITLQKCAVVDVEHDPQTAYIRLLINNTDSLLSRNITDLILLDNITGLHVQKDSGNKTRDGMQIYRKRFLQVGEYFAINYTAILDAKKTWNGRVLTLPAQLTYRSLSQNQTDLVSLTTLFTITEEEKTEVSYSHAIHASGFFIAFFVSLVLTCAVFFILYRTQLLRWGFYSKNQEIRHELSQNHKLEHSHFNSGDLFSEDVIMNDHIIDILTFEESGNMLQALEDLEVASLTRADADLEAYRIQICKEVIAMMMKNMVLSHSLIPHVEKRMSSIFKKQFLTMEREFQEEYERKVVALTAECNLETRKKMEAQRQKERAANEEAEELMKKVNEMPAVEYRSLLDRLHSLEQDHLKRFLLVKQEEYFANSYRQLTVSQRKELHNIFFTQITNATFKGELKLEIAKSLVEDYSKIQGDIEELMDFLQASKKYHLNRRFAYREYLIRKIQLRDSQASALINAAATQILNLINKMERAGHLHESHLEMLLDQAEAEINSVKQKFDHDLKQEKQKLHQKLITKRKWKMLQKKEQLSVGHPFETSREITDYLNHWKTLLSDHAIEFEELTEKLDNEGSEELRDLIFNLTEKTVEDLKLVQYGVFVQELIKLSVPKMFLLEVVEEHKKEIIVKHEHLEREEREKSTAAEELLQLTRQKLSQELENSLSQQKKLRSWEQSVFMQLLTLPLSLSEEELLKMRQKFHCCFSQLDSSLALPKIRARALLQTFELEWRDAQLLKISQNLAMTSKQPHSKTKKTGSKNRNKIDILKKSLQDKIFIYEDSAKVENLTKMVLGLTVCIDSKMHLGPLAFLRSLSNSGMCFTAEKDLAHGPLQSAFLEDVLDGKSKGLSSIQSLKVRANAYARVRQAAKCILPLSDNLRALIRVCINLDHKSYGSWNVLNIMCKPVWYLEWLTKEVNYELLLEKDCQIHNLENKLGEYIASLEFQKSVKKCKMLELYAAIISVQALLLENLSMSKTLSKSECIQILKANNPEIEELDRKLEYEMLHKESVQQQQHLMSKQRWTPDGLRPSNEAVETNVDRQVTFLLRQAMNRCMQFINLHQQSLRDEQWNCMVLEDLLENIEMDAFSALYSQELQLAGYLARLTRVPMGMLHRILNLLLPSSTQSEILSILDSIGVYSDAAESDSNADESGSCKKRRNQEWQALEYKVREDLISKSLERILSLNRRKDSWIKKKQLALLERPSFIHLESLPTRPPVEQPSPRVSFNSVTAEAIEVLDTGEKIFLFRDRSDPTLSFHNYPRKKKKNFLNSRKAARASIN